MAIFDNDREEDKIKKRAEEFEKKYAPGPAPVEEGVEEGDWMDYLVANPMTLVKQGTKAAVRELGGKVARSGQRKGVEALRDRMPGSKKAEHGEGMPVSVESGHYRPAPSVEAKPGVLKYSYDRKPLRGGQ